MKNITFLKPQGYCAGVIQAIRRLLDYKKDHPNEQITLFGPLVHNQFVVDALKDLNINMVDNSENPEEVLRQIQQGTVVFSAHGISEHLIKQALTQGLKVLDLSCPFVLKTRSIVLDKLKSGYTIFYIGKKSHPEAKAILSISDKIHGIEKKEDIPSDILEPIFVTNQTTYSILDLKDLFDAIQDSYPEAELSDEICSATRMRQQALTYMDPTEFDLIVIVGDDRSHNTQKLAKTAAQKGFKKVVMVESAQDLTKDLFDYKKIAITSGASTPFYITNQVAQSLEQSEILDFDPADLKNILEADRLR